MSTVGRPRRRLPRFERLVSGGHVEAQAHPRSCAHPGCATMLSRYNPDETCCRHGGWSDVGQPRGGRGRTAA